MSLWIEVIISQEWLNLLLFAPFERCSVLLAEPSESSRKDKRYNNHSHQDQIINLLLLGLLLTPGFRCCSLSLEELSESLRTIDISKVVRIKA